MSIISDVTSWLLFITGILVIWASLFLLIDWALKQILTYFKIYRLFFQFMLDNWKKKKEDA